MMNYEKLKLVVVKGLKDYLNIPVIRADQNQKPPKMPYGTYKAITPMGENNGTYGEYEDGIARKVVKSIWSFSFLSDNEAESFEYANKARTWLDYVGALYLEENDVVVESVGAVGNRDNLLTAEYEYKKGFDCTFTMFDEVEMPDNGTIETIDLGNGAIDVPPTTEELIERLEKRLDGEVV